MHYLRPVLLAFALGAPLAAADVPRESAIVPEAVAPADALSWEGPQIVRADRIGNVYFFRSETLEVYPLTRAGKLAEPARLEVLGNAPQVVRDAALSPGGDTWFVSADLGVRLFVDGKEKAVPALEWRPSGIGFHRDAPVVSMLPLPVAWDQVYRERKGQPPRVLEFDGNRWNLMAGYPDLSATELGERHLDRNHAVANYASFVTAGSEGRLWLARQYAYDIEQLTATGKSRVRIVVDGGKVSERSPEGAAKDQPTGFNAFRANAAILDLVEGRDGRAYFLAAGGEEGAGGLVLDRYDPVLAELQRIPLGLQLPGRLTMASGKSGLYLAAWNGNRGRWLVRWETLEEANWKPVPKAEISPSAVPSAPAAAAAQNSAAPR